MLKQFLARVTGNLAGQVVLEFCAFVSQYFQGIGSGASVADSGERAIFDFLKQRQNKERLCIFDVGANEGQFLNLALSMVQRESLEVHCFEPSKAAFAALSRRENSSDIVSLNNCGLGREKGCVELYYDTAGSGLASLTKRDLKSLGIEFVGSETIELNTLDDYCVSHDVGNIDLLKVDVEGHELDVLLGGSKMFKEKAISCVSFEFGGCNIDTRTFFRDFFDFFSAHGMSIFRITPSGYLFPIKMYKEIHEQFRTTNFFAVRNDIAQE